MEKASGRLVYTGDILKRGAERYDVVIADENIFVVCRRRKYNGRETGETSYRMPEIYSNDLQMGSLPAYGFSPDGTWLDADTPLGRSVARQRTIDEKRARSVPEVAPAVQETPAPETPGYISDPLLEQQEGKQDE